MADGARTFSDPDTGDLILDNGQMPVSQMVSGPHFQNLADSKVGDTVLDGLAASVSELVAWDEKGREEWQKMLADNLDLLGLGPESEPDDNEYENSDTSDHPLMLTAMTRFQSKALSALLPLPDRVCHTECAMDLEAIPEEIDPEQMQAAEEAGQEPPKTRDETQEEADEAGRRVAKFMADYLLKKHPSYRADTDRILFECGMHGLGVRKVYNDMSRVSQKTRVEQIDIQRLVLSFDTKSMTCGRITEIIDMPTPDLIRNIRNGTYRAVTLASGGTEQEGIKARAEDRMQGLADDLQKAGETHRVYEVYLDLFLDDDKHPNGLARPYMMTIHAASQEILSLRRNWQEGDPDETPIERYVAYIFSPGKTPVMGMGLGHILANITRSLRKAQRRGLEAAYLQNHPSGYKLSSLKVRDSSSKLRPGEFQDVDTPTGDIRQALMLHPFDGPSQGLMALADKMEQNGRELGGIATIDFSQLMKSGVAAGPAMAAYDESTEFQTAIHARLYHAHATEMRLIMDRMREVYGNQPIPFGINSVVHPGDLTLVNLTPIMQPGQISRQRQVLEAQAMLDIANEYPDIVDRRKAVEDYVKAIGKPDVSLYILPDPSDTPPPEPADPATEYDRILRDDPVRAGMDQNHQAHIDAHAAQMKMVQVSKLPVDKGEAAMAALAAHIADHMGKQMIVEVAAGAGVPADKFEEMEPEMEAQLAPVISQQIVAIEEERRPPEPQEESKTELEFVKGQNAQQLQQQKHDHAKEIEQMKAKHAKELQDMKDAAALERAEQDDATAVEIAGMKDANSASTKAGVVSS